MLYDVSLANLPIYVMNSLGTEDELPYIVVVIWMALALASI